jgi:hypothetical protein
MYDLHSQPLEDQLPRIGQHEQVPAVPSNPTGSSALGWDQWMTSVVPGINAPILLKLPQCA